MLPVWCPDVSVLATRMFSLCVPALCSSLPLCSESLPSMVFRRSHCSSLPPCSEMIFQQVTLIDLSFRDHTSHVVCAFMSACMCAATQFLESCSLSGGPVQPCRTTRSRNRNGSGRLGLLVQCRWQPAVRGSRRQALRPWTRHARGSARRSLLSRRSPRVLLSKAGRPGCMRSCGISATGP